MILLVIDYGMRNMSESGFFFITMHGTAGKAFLLSTLQSGENTTVIIKNHASDIDTFSKETLHAGHEAHRCIPSLHGQGILAFPA